MPHVNLKQGTQPAARKTKILASLGSMCFLMLMGCSGDEVDKTTVKPDNTINFPSELKKQFDPGDSAVYMVDLRWKAPTKTENGWALKSSEIVRYRIYQTDQDGNVVTTEVPGNSTRAGIPVIDKGNYKYSITAIDAQGRESNPSTLIPTTVK